MEGLGREGAINGSAWSCGETVDGLWKILSPSTNIKPRRDIMGAYWAGFLCGLGSAMVLILAVSVLAKGGHADDISAKQLDAMRQRLSDKEKA